MYPGVYYKYIGMTVFIPMRKNDPRLKNLKPFTTDRPEPLLEKLQLRIPLSMKQEIYAQENWQEFVRQAIAKALEEKEELKSA